MFRKINPYIIRAYNDMSRTLEKELHRLDLKELEVGFLTEAELTYKTQITELRNRNLIDSMIYVNKNVWFRKRFWKKLAKKVINK